MSNTKPGAARDITAGSGIGKDLFTSADWNQTFDAIPDLIAIIDTHHRIVRVNRAMAERLGIPPEKCIGQACYSCFHNTKSPPASCPHSLLLQDGLQHNVVMDEGCLGEDFAVTVSPIHDSDGKLAGSIHVCHDITKRKHGEKELRIISARQEAILSSVPDIIMEVDRNKVYTWANPAGIEFFGTDVIGKQASSYFEGEQDTYTRVEPIFKGDRNIVYLESWQRRKDGEKRLLAWWCRTLKDAEGNTSGALSTARDITEAKRIEDALKESQSLLSETARIGMVGGWEFDINTKKQKWTEEVYRIHEVDLSYNPTLPEGINFYAPASRPVIEEAVQRAIERGEPFDLELEITTAKGNARYVHAIGKADIEHHRVYGFFQDITERKLAEKVLRERESELATLFDNVSDPVFSLDLVPGEQYRFKSVNPAFLKITGLKASQVFGKLVDEVIPEPSLSLVLAKYRQAIHSRERVYWEEFTRYPVGDKIGEVTIAPIFDEKGVCTNMIGTVHDITERKKAEAALKASEDKFRTVADFTYDWEYWLGQDGKFIYISPSCERITGYSSREILSNPNLFEQIIHPDDRTKVMEHVKTSLTSPAAEHIDFRIISRDGKEIWISHFCQPVFDSEGNRQGVRGSNRDVTERKKMENALQDSEEHLRSILLSMADWAWEVDKNGVYTSSSSKCFDLLGYTGEEIIGKTPFDFMPPDEVERVGPIFSQIVETKDPIKDMENWNVRKDGKKICLLTNGIPMLDKEGNLNGYIGVDKDITDRKQAEAALLESEEKLRSIIDNSSDQIFMLDKDCRYLSLNKALAGICGKTVKEMISKTVFEFYPEDTAIRFTSNIKNVFETGKSMFLEEKMEAGGNKLYINTSLNPVKDEAGKVIAVAGIVRDITERKAAEVAVRESQEMLQNIMNLMPIRIFWKDKNLNFLGCNNAFAHDAGKKSPEELVGKDDFQMGWKEQAESYRADDQKVMTSGQVKLDYEEAQTTPAGSKIWLMTNKLPLRDKEGNITGVLGSYMDITERKLAELAIQRSEEKFRKAFDTSPDSVMITRAKDGLFVSANKGFEKMSGYNQEEIAGKTSLEINFWKNPEDRKRMIEILKVEDTVINFEAEFRKKDGSTFSGLMSASLIDLGDEPHLLNITRDITEQKAAEKMLKSSEERFRSLFDSMIEGVAIHEVVRDENGIPIDYKIIDVNPAFTTHTGLKGDAVRGKLASLAYGTGVPPLFDRYLKVAETGESSSFDEEFSPLGKHFYISAFSLGKDRFVTVFEDITGRKLAEDALRNKTALLEAQMNSSIDGILVVDTQGKKIIQNRRTVELWKIPQHILDNPDDNAQVQHVKNMTKNPEQFVEKIIYLYSHPNETSHDEVELTDGTILERYSAPVLGKDAQCYGRIWSFHDITERKTAEEAIRKRKQELERFNRLAVDRELKMVELKQQLKELKEKAGGWK